MTESKVSAISEAGVGTDYEFWVGTFLLGWLAQSAPFRFGDQSAKIDTISFQQGHLNTKYDDWIVRTLRDEDEEVWGIQAKRTVVCQGSDETFIGLIQNAIKEVEKPNGLLGQVIVCEQISSNHYTSLREVLEYARSSRDWVSFVGKARDNRSIRDMVRAIQTAAGDVVEDTLLEALTRLQIWHLPLEDGGGNEWRIWRDALGACVDGSKIINAEQLRNALHAQVAQMGRFRAERDASRLRSLVPGLGVPTIQNPGANPFAEDQLDLLASRIEPWDAQRHRKAFETLEECDLFLQEMRLKLKDVPQIGPSWERARALVVEAEIVRGQCLQALDYNERLRTWLRTAVTLAPVTDRLRLTIALGYLHIDDHQEASRWAQRLSEDHWKRILNARISLATGSHESLNHLLSPLLDGPYRLRAIDVLRESATVRVFDRTMTIAEIQALWLQILEYSKELASAPTNPVIGLIVHAENVLVSQSPGMTLAYNQRGIFARPDAIDQVNKVLGDLESVVESDLYGIYEKVMAAYALTKAQWATARQMRLPAQVTECLTKYLPHASGERVLNFSDILIGYGQEQFFQSLLFRLSEDDDTDVRRRAFKWLDYIDQRPSIPVAFEDDLEGVHFGRGCFESLCSYRDIVPEGFWEEAKRAEGTAYEPAIKCVDFWRRGEFQQALNEAEVLIADFPYAFLVYSVLIARLADEILGRGTSIDDTDAPGEDVRCCLILLRHASEALGIPGAFDRWLELARRLNDVKQLNTISRSAAEAGYRHGECKAAIVEEVLRGRSKRAIEIYDRFVSEGWRPDPGSFFLYDQARVDAGEYDAVASELQNILAEERFGPGRVRPHLFALCRLSRGEEAIAAAIINRDDFVGDPEGDYLLYQTARWAKRKDHLRFLLEFSSKHPEDPRAARTLSLDDPQEKETIEEEVFQPTHSDNLRVKVSEGGFPLHRVGNNLSQEYEKALRSAGLCLWKPWFQVAHLDSLRPGLLLDLTAILTITEFDLWDILLSSGLTLVVHPSVRYGLTMDVIDLDIETGARKGLDAARAERDLRALTRDLDGVLWLDTDEACRVEAEYVNSWDASAVSVLAVVNGNDTFDRKTKGRIKHALKKHMHSSVGSDESVKATRVLLSPLDFLALSRSEQLSDFLQGFESVSLSRSGMHWFGRMNAHDAADQCALDRARSALESLDRALNSGSVTLFEDPEWVSRPTSEKYFEETARVALQYGFTVWSDDLFFRRLQQSLTANKTSCSTWEVVAAMFQSGAMTNDDATDLAVEMWERRFGIVPLDDFALVLQAKRGWRHAAHYLASFAIHELPENEFELELIAHQHHAGLAEFLRMVSVGRVEAECIKPLIRRTHTKLKQSLFDVVVTSLGLAGEDRWRDVKDLAQWGARTQNVRLDRSLPMATGNSYVAILDQALSDIRNQKLHQFELRWRAAVRRTIRRAQSAQ